jgi:hypothetical protein
MSALHRHEHSQQMRPFFMSDGLDAILSELPTTAKKMAAFAAFVSQVPLLYFLITLVVILLCQIS